MAEAKDEAGGRAKIDTWNLWRSMGTDFQVATRDHVVTMLLANPEARMAVLEKMPEYTKLREAAHAAACAWSRDGDGDKTLVGKRMNALYLLTSNRDRALFAPTAESGKDSVCYCPQYQSSDIPCPPGQCPNVPPAPVAEAPERVTHQQAMDAMNTLSTRPESESLPARRVVRSYITQQARARTKEGAKAASRLVHLEEAAELLRKRIASTCKRPEERAWHDRDQALSAPTAGSGKDVASPPPSDAERCKRTVHSFKGMVRCLLAEGHGGFHSYDEPAPVAEAPERVTREQLERELKDSAETLADVSELAARLARWARKNYLMDKGLPEELHELEESLHGRSLGNQGDAYTSLALRRAEQSEREVAELRTQLTDANLNAEGLRVELEHASKVLAGSQTYAEMATKLAESERKLGEQKTATERLWKDCDCLPGWKALNPIGEHNPRCDMHPSETEHAGVEVGKADTAPRRFSCSSPGCSCRKESEADDPTPTETEAPAARIQLKDPKPSPMPAGGSPLLDQQPEAPAMFRVGQRVRGSKRAPNGCFGGEGTVTEIAAGHSMPINVVWDNQSSNNYAAIELEPADPAPPKPGAAKLTGPVEAFRAELVAALRKAKDVALEYGDEALLFLADELEREGGGKS